MRTTLVIPDELYREVKATAAMRGCTVTSLVEEGLRRLLADEDVAGSVTALPVSSRSWSFTPEFLASGVDVDDTSAVLAWLDGDEGLGG